MAAIGISPNDRFVASAGGQDDPTILIWDIKANSPICGKKTIFFVSQGDQIWQFVVHYEDFFYLKHIFLVLFG